METAAHQAAQAGSSNLYWIACGIFLAPILPRITDSEAAIRATMQAAKEAGASFVWSGPLRLAPDVREHYLATIAVHYPDLLDRYQRNYQTADAPRIYRDHIRDRIHRSLQMGKAAASADAIRVGRAHALGQQLFIKGLQRTGRHGRDTRRAVPADGRIRIAGALANHQSRSDSTRAGRAVNGARMPRGVGRIAVGKKRLPFGVRGHKRRQQ